MATCKNANGRIRPLANLVRVLVSYRYCTEFDIRNALCTLYYNYMVACAFPGRHWKSDVSVIKKGTAELQQYKLFIKMWEHNG